MIIKLFGYRIQISRKVDSEAETQVDTCKITKEEALNHNFVNSKHDFYYEIIR